MFADDVVIFSSHSDLKQLFLNIQSTLSTTSVWYCRNLLLLNERKCQYMLFSRVGSVNSDVFSLYLNNVELKRVQQFRYLGIIIDENLSFHEHVKIVSVKFSRKVGIMCRLRHVFPVNILKSIYFSLVHPFFLYSVSVWASTFPSVYKPLQILQNKAIRILFQIDNRSSVTHLFGSVGIFSLHQLHFIAISQICHNYVFGQLASHFHGIFPLNSQRHSYPTSLRFNLSQEFRRTTRAGFSLRHIGPKVWNSIPLDIRECADY